MITFKTIRIALLLTGMGAMGVSAVHGRDTTPTHKKRSAAKPSASGKGQRSAAGNAASSGKSKSSSTNAGGSKSTGTKSAASKTGAKSGKRGGKKSTGRQRGQTAPTPERISEIQQALAKNGAFSGEPSGKWDDSTVDAMRKYQAAHGLNPTGKLDALTLRQLGLGSATAGVAPPTPMVRTSAVALPSDIQQ
jgi:hypothetical protein